MNNPEVIKVSCVSSFSSTNAGEDWGHVAKHEVELPVLSEYEGERHGREVIASKSFSPPVKKPHILYCLDFFQENVKMNWQFL